MPESERTPTLMARVWAGDAPKNVHDTFSTGYRVDGFFGAEIGHFIDPKWSAQAHVGFLWVTETQADLKGIEVDHGSGRLDLSEYGVGANRYFADSEAYLGLAVAAVRQTAATLADYTDSPRWGRGIRFLVGLEMRLGDYFHLGGRAWLGIQQFPGRSFNDDSITLGLQGSLSLY